MEVTLAKWRRVGALASASLVPGLVFLAGAFLKASHPDSMDGVWRAVGVSGQTGTVLVVALTMLEASLGALLLLLPLERQVRVGALVTLSLFSAGLVGLLLMNKPPSCGCLGGLKLFSAVKTELAFGLSRNLILIAGLVLPAWNVRPAGNMSADDLAR